MLLYDILRNDFVKVGALQFQFFFLNISSVLLVDR